MRVALLSSVLALATVACSDVVTNTDVNRADSAEHGAIARGWLPKVLPPSARSIKTENNLDRNTSAAEFLFNQEDWPAFAASLQPLAQVQSPLKDWPKTVATYQSTGFVSRSFSHDATQWVFFCKPQQGLCKSYMWLVAPSAAAVR